MAARIAGVDRNEEIGSLTPYVHVFDCSERHVRGLLLSFIALLFNKSIVAARGRVGLSDRSA